MLTQRTEFSLSTQTLCGPFDQQFRRKFMGNRSVSLYLERSKLAKLPSQGLGREGKSQSTKNLLPKIREIEKIARSTGRRGRKINLYVDGVSDLELYFAKKLVGNQSTKEIIAQIELQQQGEYPFKIGVPLPGENEPYHSRTASKFYGRELISESQQGHTLMGASKTSYSTHKKWMTDAQFRQQFDKFIIKKPEQQKGTVSTFLGGQGKGSSVQLMAALSKDRQNLKRIVKKMIQEQNNETDEEQEQSQNKSGKEVAEQGVGSPGRNISWILKKCEDYQRKFTIKRGGKGLSKGFVKEGRVG